MSNKKTQNIVVSLQSGDSVTINLGDVNITISHEVALAIHREFILPAESTHQILWDLTEGINNTLAFKAKFPEEDAFYLSPDSIEAFLALVNLHRVIAESRG